MPDLPTLPPRDPNQTIDGPDLATLAPAPSPTPPATVAAGFELLGELGRGGMGVVYRARQVALNRVVALKMILGGGRATAEDRTRFLAEGEAVAALSHTGIVQVHEFGTHDDEPYFALEFCAGGSLAQKLAGTPLPPRDAAAVVEQIARAVQHAHERGIVHRDLKPANILLAGGGGNAPGSSSTPGALPPPLAGLVPKVTDFGLAKRVEGGAGLTQTGAIMGTPSYMAPEQANGDKAVGPLADVYALGAILYECLTGRPPFRAATPLDTVIQVVNEEPVPLRQLNAQAPADLETIAHKCLQKDPAKRYASAAALADDLGRWLRGETIAARPVGASERVVRWAKRNRALAAALTVAAVLLIGGTAVSTFAFVKASVETEKLSRALSRSNYFLGQARTQEGRDVEAAALLDAVRPDDRGFEWGYIMRQIAGGYTTLRGHTKRVTPVAFSPDGRRLASGSDDKTVKLWDAATGAELATLRGHTDLVATVAFSPDGRRLASGSLDQTVKVWDAATGAELATLRGHAGGVWSVAFSPDGRRLASGGGNNTVKLWDPATGAELATLRGHAGGVVSVAFSPDGRRLASGSYDNTVKLWDAATGAELATLRGHTIRVASVAFSPDGRRLASGGADNTVKVWDPATGAELATLRGHTGAVNSVAFSPDGRRLASGSYDNTVKVWDPATGAELATLRGHTNPVDSVAFSPDGRRLASGSDDKTVKLWDASNPGVADEYELGQRGYHARVNPWWHREQAQNAAKANDSAAVAFHRGWIATAWPDDADAWTQLDAACRQAGSAKQMLAACDRVLAANPNNAAARQRRAAYRGTIAATVGDFAAGPYAGLASLADW